MIRALILVCLVTVVVSAAGCAHPRVYGPADGAFIYLGTPADAAIGDQRVGALLDEIQQVGMHAVIVQATRWKTGADCEHGKYEWVSGFPERLERILDEARRREMRVYVGLVSTSAACPDPEQGTNPARTRDDVRAALETFKGLGYLASPALVGWYIPDEPGLGWARFYQYFAGITRAVKAVSPGLPVLVSPFLDKADLGFTPTQVGKLARKFGQATGVDIQVWQDSVGAGAVDLGWKRAGSRGTVEDYFRALSLAIGRDHLWANNELFTFGDPLLQGAGYRPTSIARLERQISSTSSLLVSRRFVWLEQRQMGEVDPEHAAESPRLRAAYLAAFGLEGELVYPTSYRWRTPPSPQYPDTGGHELFDGLTGDPREPAQTGWIGIPGRARVEMEFDRERRIDWVGAHLLGLKSQSIGFADELVLECDGRELGHWPHGLPATDAEIVFSNPRPLGASCRRLTVELRTSSPWTFISELEIVSERSSGAPGTRPGTP